jgi:ABC-type Fe3+ transport system substrate-binding protein
MERFLSENRAGQNLCDVIVTTSFYGHNIKKRGLFATYDSPERKFFREGYKDLQATWTSIYTNYGAFGYNTRGVPKASVPKTFNDLLKPEWKGQITMGSGTLLTTRTSSGNADPVANRKTGLIIGCAKEEFVQLVNSVPTAGPGVPAERVGVDAPTRLM